MVKINWQDEYKGEFICPECHTPGIVVKAFIKASNKRSFSCSNCQKFMLESCEINIRVVKDPINEGIIWYTNHLIKSLLCLKCGEESIYFSRIDDGKKQFKCRSCNYRCRDSSSLVRKNAIRCGKDTSFINPFIQSEDRWDLRSINPNFNDRDISIAIVNFTQITSTLFRCKVKEYIYYLCQKNTSFKSIESSLCSLRSFHLYLEKAGVSEFSEVNRSVILSYFSQEKVINKSKLGTLRNFFMIGTIKGWFDIDRDIIRSYDFPKQYRGNPEPLSDLVRDQIEQNIYRLPKPIARMWLVCFFCAMRPSELALLKKDCLVRESQHWKVSWYRTKGTDYQEVPVTRVIAKVIQEQQEYIQNLWGDEWKYLFCHYHNLSTTNPAQMVEAVKKVIPDQSITPLSAGIRSLIAALDIRDENGQLGKFQSKLVRSTRLTQLFEEGHDLKVVSAWAGHENLRTTSKYYTKVSCDLIAKEAGHIQQALVNKDGHPIAYESFPKSFFENPTAHKIELAGTHLNTPISGRCGIPLDRPPCTKFRACYTCESFVATIEKLPQYINTRDELRAKESNAMSKGQEVMVEQYGRQAEQLDKIIGSLQQDIA